MRPLRFSIFLAAILGMLSTAGYLWAPLVVPKARHLHLPKPIVKASLPPLRIAVITPPPPPAQFLPGRVAGRVVLHLPRVEHRHAAPAAPARVAAPQVTFKRPATAPVQQPVSRPAA